MHKFPVDLLFHHLLSPYYVGNAVEMDETFCDLFHILKLKALKTKRFHHGGRDLFIMLVTASIALSRNCERNGFFVD